MLSIARVFKKHKRGKILNLEIQQLPIIHVFQLFFNSDVDIYPKDSAVMVMVNGVEIPISNLPYQDPTGLLFYSFKLNCHELFNC